MAKAPAQMTVTPKQMGKHLRSIRRGKGLSLSEVARGAGLSRRELVTYERGKAPIPESDLWVLAGSCGVDVTELVPSASSNELVLSASTTTVGDTVSQLRRAQDDLGITPYLHTLHKLQALPPGKRIPVKGRELDAIASALGSTPCSIEERLQQVLQVSPDEAERLRAMILAPPAGRGKARALAAPSSFAEAPASPPMPDAIVPTTPAPPAETFQTLPLEPAAFLDSPLDAPLDPVNGLDVDVFEELARLPEPLPLGDPAAPLPDLLAPHDPFATATPLVRAPMAGLPEGTVELVDTAMPAPVALGRNGASTDVPPTWDPVNAPPIDVAVRQGSSRWDLGEPPLTTPASHEVAPSDWETGGWQPPAPPAGSADESPAGFWESTEDWAPQSPDEDAGNGADARARTELVNADGAPMVIGDDAWAGSAWTAEAWSSPRSQPAEANGTVEVNPWAIDEWPREAADQGAWDHQPDPAAVNSGFYVDWGTSDTELPPSWDGLMTPTVVEPEPQDTDVEPLESEDLFGAAAADAIVAAAFDDTSFDGTSGFGEPEPTHETGSAPLAPIDIEPEAWPDHEPEVAPIFWRSGDEVVPDEVVPVVEPWVPTLLDLPVAPEEAVVAVAAEEFVSAGSDWQLGNALPLVEVRSQGALVMRRADERWALADVPTTPDFAVEIDVDFRSGPGFGVLFRASVDDEGRMSGYSFDIDPIYDGGGYLVRQWHADRELWNPIARVGGTDPASMHGRLTVRLVVSGEHLTALVNGAEVLTVDHLEEASVERGRDGASGERVGVQAWSSTDLVIETLRVAAH